MRCARLMAVLALALSRASCRSFDQSAKDLTTNAAAPNP